MWRPGSKVQQTGFFLKLLLACGWFATSLCVYMASCISLEKDELEFLPFMIKILILTWKSHLYNLIKSNHFSKAPLPDTIILGLQRMYLRRTWAFSLEPRNLSPSYGRELIILLEALGDTFIWEKDKVDTWQDSEPWKIYGKLDRPRTQLISHRNWLRTT